MERMRKLLLLAGVVLAGAQASTTAKAQDWQLLNGKNTEHIHYSMPGQGQPRGIVILLSGCGGFDGEGLPAGTMSQVPGRGLKDEQRIIRRHYNVVADKLNKLGFVAVRFDFVRRILEKKQDGKEVRPVCEDVGAAFLEIDFKNSIAEDLEKSLADIQRVAPGRDTHVIGWSLGARGALEAVTNPAHNLNAAFASVSLYSPSCLTSDRPNWRHGKLQLLNTSSSFRFLLMYGSDDDIHGVAKGESNCQKFLKSSGVNCASMDRPPAEPMRCVVAGGAKHSFDVGHQDDGVHFKSGKYESRYDRSAAEAAWELVRANLGL